MLENKPKKVSDREYYLFAFRIIGDFGVTIAVPVIIFVLIGQYLDGKYGTNPWLTVLGIIVAALITAKIIYKKAKCYGKEYQDMDQGRKEETK